MAKKPGKGIQFLAVLGAVAAMIAVWRFPLPLGGLAQPTTLLSVVAILLGITLGPWRAAVMVLCYVLAVIMGIPPLLFGGASGEPFLDQPLSGFSLGLIAAALVAGYLAPQRVQSGPAHLALAAILGHLAYLIVGIAWLTRFGPLPGAIHAVMASQMIAVLLKTAIAFLAAFGLNKVAKH